MNAHQRRIKRRRSHVTRIYLSGRLVTIYTQKSEAFRDALARVNSMRGNFEQSNVLHELAAEYCRRTEAFDRTVCTGPMGIDGILPATPRESGAINHHARAVWLELLPRVRSAGFTEQEFRRAVGNYQP